jgi:hypothetical protein
VEDHFDYAEDEIGGDDDNEDDDDEDDLLQDAIRDTISESSSHSNVVPAFSQSPASFLDYLASNRFKDPTDRFTLKAGEGKDDEIAEVEEGEEEEEEQVALDDDYQNEAFVQGEFTALEPYEPVMVTDDAVPGYPLDELTADDDIVEQVFPEVKRDGSKSDLLNLLMSPSADAGRPPIAKARPPVVPPPSASSDSLPIDAYKDEIIARVNRDRVVIIHGETGCGKSSRLPIFLLQHAQSSGKVRAV